MKTLKAFVLTVVSPYHLLRHRRQVDWIVMFEIAEMSWLAKLLALGRMESFDCHHRSFRFEIVQVREHRLVAVQII